MKIFNLQYSKNLLEIQRRLKHDGKVTNASRRDFLALDSNKENTLVDLIFLVPRKPFSYFCSSTRRKEC